MAITWLTRPKEETRLVLGRQWPPGGAAQDVQAPRHGSALRCSWSLSTQVRAPPEGGDGLGGRRLVDARGRASGWSRSPAIAIGSVGRLVPGRPRWPRCTSPVAGPAGLAQAPSDLRSCPARPGRQHRLPLIPRADGGCLPARHHPPRPSSIAAERSSAGWGASSGPALRPCCSNPRHLGERTEEALATTFAASTSSNGHRVPWIRLPSASQLTIRRLHPLLSPEPASWPAQGRMTWVRSRFWTRSPWRWTMW
jgi:hypothetical protein